MKERPIFFSAPMAKAIRDRRKTQTRRIIKPQPPIHCSGPAMPSLTVKGAWDFGWPEDAPAKLRNFPLTCPYGVPGDRLVFLCGWATEKRYNKTKPSALPTTARIWTYFDGDEKPEWCGRIRMGRHMPGWARAKMPRGDVTDVRVQRVQEISEDDAIAEGIQGREAFPANHPDGVLIAPSEAFLRLFYDINKRAPRGENPWVFAITFAPVQPAMSMTVRTGAAR